MIPITGPVTLQMIATEFGGTAPHNLSEYYAGGAYVPSGTTGINGPIPSSGQLSLGMFRGSRIVTTVSFTAGIGIGNIRGVHTVTNSEAPFGTWNTPTIPIVDGIAAGPFRMPQPANYVVGQVLTGVFGPHLSMSFMIQPFETPNAGWRPFANVSISGPGVAANYTANDFIYNATANPYELFADTFNVPFEFVSGTTYQVVFT